MKYTDNLLAICLLKRAKIKSVVNQIISITSLMRDLTFWFQTKSTVETLQCPELCLFNPMPPVGFFLLIFKPIQTAVILVSAGLKTLLFHITGIYKCN